MRKFINEFLPDFKFNLNK